MLIKNIYRLVYFFFFLITFFFNFWPVLNGEQQYVFLARSFLQGKTYFLSPPHGSWADTTPYLGHYYYPAGPLPIIPLMPFVFVFDLLGKTFLQGYLQAFLVLGVFFLVTKIAKKLGYNHDDSLFLGFAFCFASAFLGVAFWPWRSFFGHVLTTLLILGAILEYLTKKRPLVIGTLMGLAMATRFTAGVGIIFFVLAQRRWIIKLAAPFAVILLILGFYNFINYHNFLDFGFKNIIHPFPAFAKAASQGIFSLYHLPTNLYYSLLSLPWPSLRANPWGMSIFLTSPYLFYLFRLKFKDRESKLLLLTIFLIALPLLLLYTPGFRQFGYRYSLDFFPFLFFLLFKNYKNQFGNLSKTFKLIVIVTAFTNLYLFVTLFS